MTKQPDRGFRTDYLPRDEAIEMVKLPGPVKVRVNLSDGTHNAVWVHAVKKHLIARLEETLEPTEQVPVAERDGTKYVG